MHVLLVAMLVLVLVDSTRLDAFNACRRGSGTLELAECSSRCQYDGAVIWGLLQLLSGLRLYPFFLYFSEFIVSFATSPEYKLVPGDMSTIQGPTGRSGPSYDYDPSGPSSTKA